MNGTCFECKFMRQRTDLEPCEYCTNVFASTGVHPNFEAKRKPITNYDRLIRKTSEEMAEKIGESIDCEVCKTMHHSESGECPCRPHQSCVDFWLDWLKQEAKDEK